MNRGTRRQRAAKSTLGIGGVAGMALASAVPASSNGVNDETNVVNGIGTGAETDVVWNDANLAPRTHGTSACVDWWGGTPSSCDRGLANIDPAEIAANDPFGGGFENNVTKTACHENGHTMGLSHYKAGSGPGEPPVPGQGDCMIGGGVIDASDWRVYAGHHKAHLNCNFPTINDACDILVGSHELKS